MPSLVVVTGANHRYYRSLRQLLESFRRHHIDRLHRVIFYDLGLTREQRAALASAQPHLEVRDFPFAICPPFVARNREERPGDVVLGCYAWKPVIIDEVLAELGGLVLWMDAANLVRGSLQPAVEFMERHGTYVPFSGVSTLAQRTRPATLERMGVPWEYWTFRQRGTGLCGFNGDYPGVRELVREWRAWSMDESVIAPPGARTGEHNYDQSILVGLLARAEVEQGWTMTGDEQDISSRNPINFVAVRKIVPNWVPLCLDPLARLAFEARTRADVALLRLRHFHLTWVKGLHQWPKEHYRVLLRRTGGPFRPIPSPRLRYFADPFLVEKDGREFVFFEDFDYRLNRARISAAQVWPDLSTAPPVPVLERDYHMSYPFLHWEGQRLVMIPETHQISCIDLYECHEFPYRWRLRKRLLYGVDAADTTLLVHDRHYYLFTAVRDRGPGRFLCIFVADGLDGPYRAHPVNGLRLYEELPRFSGRCAGPIFREAGQLIRPAQDNPDTYGQFLRYYRIDELTPRTFRETALGRMPQPVPDCGTHHQSRTGRLEAVDIRDRFSYFPWRRPGLPPPPGDP